MKHEAKGRKTEKRKKKEEQGRTRKKTYEQ